MLGFFRTLAGTWPARIFFLALAAAFVGWGVSSKVSLTGGDTNSIATVDGSSVSTQEFQQQFREDMQRIGQRFPDPSQIPPDVRQKVAAQTLERVVTGQALENAAQRMGIVAPEVEIQKSIRAMPAFQGIDGSFDHNTYVQVLSQHNLTPQRFQDEIRMDVAKNQILTAVVSGVQPSDMLTNLVFQYLRQTRTADVVHFTFAGHTPPPAPADAVLQRYADNNVAKYTSPEYRRIRAVILSPATIGKSLSLPDADLHAWYTAHKDEFQAPEKRSMQVVTASSADAAAALAASWKAGASWDSIQADAKRRAATATSLDNTTKAGIPAPELAAAAFAAPLNTITGPIQEPLGYQVVNVTSITPAKHPSFEDLRGTVQQRLGEERAADLIDERAQKLQDLFAGGSHIDEVPADMGIAGVQGTLDAQGNTPLGGKAPIPAPDDVKLQLIADAFKTAKGQTTQLTEAANHVWYAVQVDDITKPAVKPFDQIHAQVLADWQAEQVRHQTEQEAAHLLSVVNGGQSITSAAWGTGKQVIRTPPLQRNKPTKGVPAELSQIVFSLKAKQATMVETSDGFIVAQLAQIIRPDPKSDTNALDDVRHGLTQALADDVLVSFGSAIRDDGKPVVNTKVYQQLTQPAGQ